MPNPGAFDRSLQQRGGVLVTEIFGGGVSKELATPLPDQDGHCGRATLSNPLDQWPKMRRPDGTDWQVANLGEYILLKVFFDLIRVSLAPLDITHHPPTSHRFERRFVHLYLNGNPGSLLHYGMDSLIDQISRTIPLHPSSLKGHFRVFANSIDRGFAAYAITKSPQLISGRSNVQKEATAILEPEWL
ncbi:hypothetical protein GCM10027428_25540 [Haliea atlantica]